MHLVNRFLSIFVLVAVLAGGATPAQGQAKTPKEQARESFQRGFAYYQAGQYLKAVQQLKKAYKIRPVPLVLFYIGKTYQAAQLTEESIIYFRKFLDEARLTDPKRKEAKEAIKAMGGSLKARPGPQVTPRARPETRARPRPRPRPRPRRKVRRVKPGEIIHEIIEEARPNLPLLVEAELPESIDWARLYLYFRTPGMAEFKKRLMKPGRRGIYSYLIHHNFMQGKSLQYYIEAVGRTGKRIAGSGTATSPNIVLLSEDAPMQPGGRMDDSGQLAKKGKEQPGGTKIPSGPTETPKTKWKLYGAVALTATTVAMLASGIALGVQSRYKAQDIADAGTAKIPGGGWDYPPYRDYDSGLQDSEDKGKSYEIGSIVCYVLAGVAAGGASYLWMDHFGVFGGEEKPEPEEQTSTIVPILGKNKAGVGYSLEF